MRRLFLLFLAFTAISCIESKPIEKYQDKGYVVIEDPIVWNSDKTKLILKSPDTIFKVYVHPFDAENLKVGDTLKSKNK